MPTYKDSRVVSIRVDQELLQAVRERANAAGRSLSGEIVFVLRDRVKAEPLQRKKGRITGWLSQLTPPDKLRDFRSGRKQASAALLRAVQRKARAR